MHRQLIRRVAAGVLVATALTASALAQPAKGAKPAADVAKAEEELAYSVGVQAYIWSYPLVITGATALVATNADKPMPNAHAPFNTFGNVAKLFTAADKDVVSSNVDTVYSSAFVDLKQGAALVSVPATNGRYYSLMLEDAYTNVFGYIGKRVTGDQAGKYLITGPGWKGKTPDGVGKVIEAPTSLVWIIGRTLVDNEADLANVRALQAQYRLEMIPPVLDGTPIKQRWSLPAGNGKVPVEMVEALDWKNYFQWVGQLMKDNPPLPADTALAAQFPRIGLSAEKGFDSASLSEAQKRGLARAYESGKLIVKQEALKSGGTEANGWAYNLTQGKWGLDYNLRAGIAYRSLGQNQAEEAIYYNTRKDGRGQTLNGKNRYTLTFKPGQLPPVDAFWSVTMYNAQNFFVENPIQRLALGNRTPGLKNNADGSLTVTIQKAAPADDKKSNWLPAPDGDFRLSLRMYIPKEAALKSEWVPPAVQVATP